MKNVLLRIMLAMFAFTFNLAVCARAQTETTLYSFPSKSDGYSPLSDLTFDASGNLYGTTSEGGNLTLCSGSGCGVVYELSPVAGGGWLGSTPHVFGGGGDGKNPFAGLAVDAAGNLYGATGLGYESIFELSPVGGGWTKSQIHYFQDSKGGNDVYSKMIFDSAGNLYGMGHNGGDVNCNCGVVFELQHTATGWKEIVLHTFVGANGSYPDGSLIFDSAGNLYGATSFGSAGCTYANCGIGIVFMLSPVVGAGPWKETPLYEFSNKEYGAYPNGSLIFDAAGNLYGTTSYGGNLIACAGGSGCGTVFELSPTAAGAWKHTELYAFSDTDGAYPLAGFVADSAGNLYGTASQGGPDNCGVVFKMTLGAGGSWTESTTYSFTCLNDGGYLSSGLITDSAGNLYGTASRNGANNNGTVFEITP